jgi:sensor histidine kinase YesM
MSMLLEVNKNYYEKLEASELAFLQAQIKPHFIFNTMNTLIAISYEDIDKTRMLMGKFSQYLRNSFDFSGTNQYVSFEKEMDYVKAFVEIEKARFEERLSIDFDIDEDIHTQVPILVLQPIIENAIVHGILPGTNSGHITISVKKQKDDIVFCVQDNGVGFDIRQLEKTPQNKQTYGIGLYNIDRRLKKMTKDGLQIKSEIGIGTKVCWHIPMGKRRKK